MSYLTFASEWYRVMQTLQFVGVGVLCAHTGSPQSKGEHVQYMTVHVLTWLKSLSSLGVNRRV